MKMQKEKLYTLIKYKNNTVYFTFNNKKYEIIDSTIKNFTEMHNLTNNLIRKFNLI